MTARRRTAVAAVVVAMFAVAGCSTGTTDTSSSSKPSADHSAHGSHGDESAAPVAAKPLRQGERRVALRMPEPYTPSAPYGTGTDDYRCFVLDPHLDHDAFITGLDIAPGSPSVVHHVILFQAPPSAVAAAEQKDASEEGEGWTCFGGTGLEGRDALQDAPWLGAWAPGGSEQVLAKDVGVPIAKGSRVIMQVHYNLLAGPKPDVSAAELRLAPANADLDPLETILLPAPVELPCRPGHEESELCDRSAAVADAEKRFGEVGQTANYLHFMCGQIQAGPVQTCDRRMEGPATIRAAAGHMHLLGRSIKIQVNPDTDRARTVLDIPVWDFDNQGARPVQPIKVRTDDVVRVTCRHDQALRDVLPAFKDTEEKYVVWGEGTTDEMCLGILLVTRP